MAEIDKGLLAQAIREWSQAPHRDKGRKIGEWCRVLGIGRDAFYREAGEWGRMKERKAREEKRPRRLAVAEIEKHVATIIAIKHRPPAGVRVGSTENAVRYAAAHPDLYGVPMAILDVPLGTINRIARELNLRVEAERQVRFEALYANQVHQFDASHSEHFMVARQDGKEWILKLAPRWMKNKDRAERLKVIAYGICDDHSGYRLSQYTIGAGESALASIEFLKWAWSAEPEHLPFEGWPDELYVDNGPLARHQAFDEFAKRLELKVTAHLPYKSRCTGKVENNWRTQWKNFETTYFFNPGWQNFEISLTELNQELAAFWRERWNQRRHRRLPWSREEAWHKSIVARGGVVRVEPGAWDTIFVDAERTLDAAGCFNFKGPVYQVREIWSCKVKVFANIRDGSLVVQAPDGRRYRAVPFEMQEWGDFRGSPKSELTRLKEEDAAAPKVSAPPTWQRSAGGDACATKITFLPVRQAEVRESGFELPPGEGAQAGMPAPLESLEELAQGVRIIERDEADPAAAEEPLAPTLDQYVALKIKEARGERLTEREAAFLPYFQEECAGLLKQFGGDVAMRVKLALVG